jgi:hypothetical protein
MDKSRFDQLHKLHMRRDELVSNISKINEPLIEEIWEENLRKYILEKVVDISYNDLVNLKHKLITYEGIETPQNIKLVKIFYTLLTKKIILPSWLDKKDFDTIRSTLDWIVDRYNKKLNQKILKKNNNYFDLSLWDEESLDRELEDEFEITPRNFELGWIFWELYMWMNDKEERFTVDIPVRLSMKKWAIEQKYVDADKLKEIITKYFPKKSDSKNEFSDFKVKTW